MDLILTLTPKDPTLWKLCALWFFNLFLAYKIWVLVWYMVDCSFTFVNLGSVGGSFWCGIVYVSSFLTFPILIACVNYTFLYSEWTLIFIHEFTLLTFLFGDSKLSLHLLQWHSQQWNPFLLQLLRLSEMLNAISSPAWVLSYIRSVFLGHVISILFIVYLNCFSPFLRELPILSINMDLPFLLHKMVVHLSQHLLLGKGLHNPSQLQQHQGVSRLFIIQILLRGLV